MSLTKYIIILGFYITLIITLLFGLRLLNFWPQNEVKWLETQSFIEMHRHGIEGKYSPVGIVYKIETFQIPKNNKKKLS